MKETDTVQLEPGARDGGQLFVAKKLPEAEIAESEKFPELLLVKVTAEGALALPTGWLGNVRVGVDSVMVGLMVI